MARITNEDYFRKNNQPEFVMVPEFNSSNRRKKTLILASSFQSINYSKEFVMLPEFDSIRKQKIHS